jgi:hypothetical protein
MSKQYGNGDICFESDHDPSVARDTTEKVFKLLNQQKQIEGVLPLCPNCQSAYDVELQYKCEHCGDYWPVGTSPSQLVRGAYHQAAIKPPTMPPPSC